MGKFLTDIDLNQNELQYAVIQNLNTDPIVSTTGQIYYNTNISKLRLKTLAGWVTISTATITIPTLQQVVDSGNSISNFGGIGTADILSVNFTNNRSLYLNNSSSPTIKIVDNLNASHYTIFDIDTLNLNGAIYNWSSIVNPATSLLSALPFTTDHLTATNNQYIIGDLVWYLGNVYRCIANNDSLLPTNTSYWTNLGIGYSLVQQPSDWNATSGNNQILNKPTIPSVTPAALTKTDDTNVILTLGGTPTTALLQGVSLTVGWTGTLADARIASAAYWNAKQNAITTGTTLQYFRGDLSLATFPVIPTVGTWGALNYPTWLAGTPFVKMTAAGTFALDSSIYLTGITSLDVTTALGFTPYNNTNPSGYTSNLGTVTSVAQLTLGTTGTDLTSTVATGTTTPVITLNVPTASATSRGALSSADWTAFSNRKRQIVNDTISVTTTGVAVATLVKTYEITTGTLPISGFLDIFMYLTRSGATSGGYTLSISVNSVNNFATSTFIAGLSAPGNFVQTLPLKAKLVLKSGTVTGTIVSQGTGDNYPTMTSVPTPVTCNNTAGSVWFFVYVTPTSSGQSWTLQGVEITI